MNNRCRTGLDVFSLSISFPSGFPSWLYVEETCHWLVLSEFFPRNDLLISTRGILSVSTLTLESTNTIAFLLFETSGVVLCIWHRTCRILQAENREVVNSLPNWSNEGKKEMIKFVTRRGEREAFWEDVDGCAGVKCGVLRFQESDWPGDLDFGDRLVYEAWSKWLFNS